MTIYPARSRIAYVWLRGTIVLAVCLLLLIACVGVSFLAYNAHYAARIYPRIAILGTDVGGLDAEQALKLLQASTNAYLPYVTLHTAESDWTVSVRDMGGSLAFERAVQEAWKMGRSGNFREDLVLRARLLWQGYNIVPDFSLEPGRALVYLRQIARQTGHPARRAQLWVGGLQARTGQSQTGRELDILATQEAIELQVRAAYGFSVWGETPSMPSLWQRKEFGQNTLPSEPLLVSPVFREVVPPLTEVAGAQERVSTILSSPLVLLLTTQEYQADGSVRPVSRRWSIDQARLASWLTLQNVSQAGSTTIQVTVDHDRIKSLLQELSDEIARAPREGRFDYDPKANVLMTLSPGQNGYALDLDRADALVAEACLSSRRKVDLPVRVIPPRVTRADWEALMPLQLVSEGESSFVGSTPQRLQNIRMATAQFHGVVVPAQTTFSFLEHLHLVTIANGYSESWVIYGDRTVLGPGGGVCQVSTTCFRAAFWGGFPITERSPHSYRVSWYEPPIGLDAAVFSPIVDMKFRNDTDTPLLILTQVDEKNAKLYFRFYGRPVGRKVSLEGPVTSNPIKAGDPVYEEDPALSPGTREQVEWPHDGLDVTLYRVVEQNGALVSRDKIFSHYEPWPARYRVGPSKLTPTATP
jgi:vancomycin resistance protein YoaR